MVNLIISLFLAVAGGYVFSEYVFGSVAGGIFPGILIFFVCMIFMNRFFSKKVQKIMQEAQTIMSDLNQIKSAETMKKRMPILVDKAVSKYCEGFKYGAFQFGVNSMISGQIGSLYYMCQRFEEAEPYLAKASFYQSEAVAMYACCLYKKKDYDNMKLAFDKSLKLAQRKPIIYNMYAWCLYQQNDINGAIRVLNQCKQFNQKDEITNANLTTLKNSSKMDMSKFGPQWYQYFLEAPDTKTIQMMQAAMKKGMH